MAWYCIQAVVCLTAYASVLMQRNDVAYVLIGESGPIKVFKYLGRAASIVSLIRLNLIKFPEIPKQLEEMYVRSIRSERNGDVISAIRGAYQQLRYDGYAGCGSLENHRTGHP